MSQLITKIEEKDLNLIKKMNIKQMFLFVSKISMSDKCWIWNGSLTDKGYGQFKFNKRSWLAYRIVYMIFNGDIPRELCLDHLCRNTRCVNPQHLEIVTYKENIMRGVSIVAKNNNKTVCKNGHKLLGDNVRMYKGHYRVCKKCNSINFKRFKLKKYEK